jgi:dihydrofolate reductase
MGRKTFESIGKPLPNRTSIVLSNSGFEHEGVHTFNDVQKAFNFVRESGEEELFIIGGAKIYETVFPYVDKLYLSEVDFDGTADAFLKPIDFSTWDMTEEKNHEAITEDGKMKSPSWKFKVYIKKD